MKSKTLIITAIILVAVQIGMALIFSFVLETSAPWFVTYLPTKIIFFLIFVSIIYGANKQEEEKNEKDKENKE